MSSMYPLKLEILKQQSAPSVTLVVPVVTVTTQKMLHHACLCADVRVVTGILALFNSVITIVKVKTDVCGSSSLA